MTPAPAMPQRRVNWRRVSLLLVAGLIVLVIAANAHLVWVALESQPECVVHAGAGDDVGGGQPARRAC